jgi:hypothetical protein
MYLEIVSKIDLLMTARWSFSSSVITIGDVQWKATKTRLEIIWKLLKFDFDMNESSVVGIASCLNLEAYTGL